MTLVATVDIVPDEAHEHLSAWVDVCSHSNISRMSSRYLWSGVAVLREYPNKCFASSIRTRFYWYEFDNVFLLRPPQDIADAYGSLGRDFIDKPRNFLRLRTIQGTYPQRFVDDVMPLKDGLLHLANRQLQIMDEHFPEAPADLQQAFEEFGQGILWDDRPDRVERGIPIHMMDGWIVSLRAFPLIRKKGSAQCASQSLMTCSARSAGGRGQYLAARAHLLKCR